MAKRFGKFKITNRESELSLVDGGDVNGNLSVTGTADFSGLVTATAGIRNAGVTVSNATSAQIDLTTVTGDHKLITTGTLAEAIKLPNATADNAGMVIEVLMAADVATNGNAKIQVANGGGTNFSGGITLFSTTADKADSIAIGASIQSIELDSDANDHAGGAEGSVYRFYYMSANNIFVDAKGITTGTAPELDSNATSATGF